MEYTIKRQGVKANATSDQHREKSHEQQSWENDFLNYNAQVITEHFSTNYGIEVRLVELSTSPSLIFYKLDLGGDMKASDIAKLIEVEFLELESCLAMELRVPNVHIWTQLEDSKVFSVEIPKLYCEENPFLIDDRRKEKTIEEKILTYHKAQKIVDELAKFNIEVFVTKATIGLTITLFELKLGSEVCISKISNFDDDIAMALKVGTVRIIAPLSECGTVGIEVANERREEVSMLTMLQSAEFLQAKKNMQLPIVIGKTFTNENLIFDLTKTPHLLIAGYGIWNKSCCLHSLITSLLCSNSFEELQLFPIDSNLTKFLSYEDLSMHFIDPAENIGDMTISYKETAVTKLKYLYKEMEERYQILNEAAMRNIQAYNKAIKEGLLKEEDGYKTLPYIVVLIEELADLMIREPKESQEVEVLITRLAQKARAVGIHLIVATQRTSSDVITDLIKANFPSRIAFRVYSQIDSRTIIDSGDANQLIGQGAMLYYSEHKLERVQCAMSYYSDLAEIQSMIEKQGNSLIYHPSAKAIEEKTVEQESEEPSYDNLSIDIARSIVKTKDSSLANIQRRFKLPYRIIQNIMKILEVCGILGREQGAKPREILVEDNLKIEEVLKEWFADDLPF